MTDATLTTVAQAEHVVTDDAAPLDATTLSDFVGRHIGPRDADVDRMLEADGVRPPPPALAPYHFTASSWQARPDGQPVSVPTWYLWEDGRVLVNMDRGRKRVEYLRKDPRVSISILSEDDWYTHVSIRGQVVRWEDDPEKGLADIDRLSVHYTGGPYRVRDRPRVSCWVRVDHWHGWGQAKAE